MSRRRPRLRCAKCGDDQDLSFILFDGELLCARCFPEEVKEYAGKYPFMLAEEMGLDVVHAPKEDDYFYDER